METRMARYPGFDRWGLVGAVVVHHQMHIELGRCGLIDGAQEGEELLGPVPPMHFADDFAGGDVQCRKQGRGAVAAVIMGAPLGHSRHHRLRAVERLNLAFLVHTQHQGAIRRIEVQPHHIAHLLNEQRVGGELEGLGAVRLQAQGVPDAHHRALRQSRGLGHHPAAPVRGLPRLLVQRLGDHALDLTIADGVRGSRSRLIEQTVQSRALEASAPLADRLRRHPQLPADLPVGAIVLAGQHDARPQRERLRGAVPPRPLEQSFVLFHRQLNGLELRATSHRFPLEIQSTVGHQGCINVRRIADSGH